jgi:hypothetical protein
MRRAIHHGTVSRRQKPTAPVQNSRLGSFEPTVELVEESATLDAIASTGRKFAKREESAAATLSEQHGNLAAAIIQRVESRLPGRVRNLAVRILADTVVLEGQCATYYTKQLAQHAALGILEDEHLENAIVVTVGR